MNEFDPIPTDSEPDIPQTLPPPVKKQSILTRPLFLGQSLPWLVGGVAVISFAAWFLFWPSEPSTDASQRAFGEGGGLTPVQQAPSPVNLPAQADGLTVTQNASSVPEEVVKLIREGREFEGANREAITRLSGTVRAQSEALTALQNRTDALAAENVRLTNRLTVLEARETTGSAARSSGRKTAGHSALSGMRLEGLQNGMAWVNWQNRTWAVQAGDHLGSVTVLDVNAGDRSVMTSAGTLR